MTETCFVKTFNTIRRDINTAKGLLGTWQAVGAKFGLNRGMAYMIAVKGYEPKTPRLRHKLGLPLLIPAPACPKCGVVHVARRCTGHGAGHNAEAKHWRDWPDERIRWALENREEIIQEAIQKPVYYPPDWSAESFRFGEELSEIPKPHVYLWPGCERPREVTVRIMRYYGYGPHYHVSLHQEDNPIWDGRPSDTMPGPLGWTRPWDNYPGKGLTDSDFWDDLGKSYRSRFEAREILERVLAEHFSDHKIAWDDFTISVEGEYYAGKHGE